MFLLSNSVKLLIYFLSFTNVTNRLILLSVIISREFRFSYFIVTHQLFKALTYFILKIRVLFIDMNTYPCEFDPRSR